MSLEDLVGISPVISTVNFSWIPAKIHPELIVRDSFSVPSEYLSLKIPLGIPLWICPEITAWVIPGNFATMSSEIVFEISAEVFVGIEAENFEEYFD